MDTKVLRDSWAYREWDLRLYWHIVKEAYFCEATYGIISRGTEYYQEAPKAIAMMVHIIDRWMEHDEISG